MHVAHIVFSLARGGQEKLLMDLALEQLKAGHQVSVFCITIQEGPFAETLVQHGVVPLAFGKGQGFSLRVLRSLAKELKQRQVTVLHSHNPVPNFYGALAAWMAGVRAVINTRHGMGRDNINRRRETVFKFSLKFTDRVVFVCEAARERFLRQGVVKPAMAVTIPNGVPLEGYQADRPELLKAEFLKEHRLEPGSLCVALVARLEPEKDISTYVQAADLVLREIPGARFFVIGDGRLQEALQQEIHRLNRSTQVHLLGDRRDVGKLLSCMDCFALSSVSEGMPLTLIEAMGAGLPVVATRVGGIPEVVVEGSTGCLVPPKDPEAFARAMVSVLSDPARARLLGQAGKERALRLFHLKTMMERYQALYETVLQGKKIASP